MNIVIARRRESDEDEPYRATEGRTHLQGRAIGGYESHLTERKSELNRSAWASEVSLGRGRNGDDDTDGVSRMVRLPSAEWGCLPVRSALELQLLLGLVRVRRLLLEADVRHGEFPVDDHIVEDHLGLLK